jgi:uncharacterized protein with HEPN domain
MAKRDPLITLGQLLGCLDQAREVVAGRKREDLDTDTVFRLAAERAVEVIGEAAGRLSQDFRDKHPDVPWHRVIGMRNWLAHGYDTVDLDVLWDVLARRLDELEELIRPVIESLETPPES